MSISLSTLTVLTLAVLALTILAVALVPFAFASEGSLREVRQTDIDSSMRLEAVHEVVKGRLCAANNLELTSTFLSNELPEFSICVQGLGDVSKLVTWWGVPSHGIKHVSVPSFLHREGHQSDLVESQSPASESLPQPKLTSDIAFKLTVLLRNLEGSLGVEGDLLSGLVIRDLQSSRRALMRGEIRERARLQHGLQLIDQGMGRFHPLREDNAVKPLFLILQASHTFRQGKFARRVQR